MNWAERFKKMPPRICRLLARTGTNQARRLKSNSEIAKDGGLARSTVNKISQLDSWGSIKLDTILKFIQGCGVDPMSPAKKHKRLLIRKDGGRMFLKNARGAQRKMIQRIMGIKPGPSKVCADQA